MAENATIGALRVVLGADTASLEDGLKSASNSLNKFVSSVNRIGAGLAAVLAPAALITELKGAINEMDELGKASQKIGIPVEQLSGLKYAAELADVSLQSLVGGVGKLSKAMVEAAAKPTSVAASAFKELGVSVKDANGDMRPTADVLLDISKAFAAAEDDASKTAIAIALFGKKGAELIPFLNQGKAGIKSLTEEAASFGIVIGTNAAKEAEQFNDTLKSLNAIADGLKIKLASELLPTLNLMVSALKENSKETDFFSHVVQTLRTDLDDLYKIGLVLKFAIDAITGAYSAGKAAVESHVKSVADDRLETSVFNIILQKGLELLPSWAGAVSAAGNATTGAAAAVKAASTDLATLKFNLDFAGYSVGDYGGKAADVANVHKNKLNPAFAAGGGEAEKFSQALLKIGLQTRQLKGDFDTLAPGFVDAAIRLKLIKEGAEGFQGTVATLTPQMLQLNTALMGLAGAKITQENLTSVQMFNNEMTKLNLLVQNGSISWDTWARASQKAAEQAGVSMSKLSDDVLGGWKDLFQALGKQNEQFFRMGQALAIVMAIINTAEGVTKALAQGGWLGIAMAAAVAAKGAAQIAIISQQKFTGAAQGGSFKVPGGSMGIDTKLVPMALAPGERVDVTPASKVNSGTGGVLSIPEINPQSFFTGDTVRHMVVSIDKWMRDGGTGIKMVPR